MIEEAGAELLLGDGDAVEDALDIEIVKAGARIIDDRRPRIASSPCDIGIEDEIAIMIGEEELAAVDPGDASRSQAL